MRLKLAPAAAALLGALALLPGTALGASMEADCDGLQAALDQADAGDVITLTTDCQGRSYTLPSRISSDEGYTLQGQEADRGTTLDGQGKGQVRLLRGTDTGHVHIRNLTFINGLGLYQCTFPLARGTVRRDRPGPRRRDPHGR